MFFRLATDIPEDKAPYHSAPEDDFLRPNILDNFLPKVDLELPSVLFLEPLKLLLPLPAPLLALALEERALLVGVVADLGRVPTAFG